MDNDVLRRGRPTNHIVFGEAQAILAGDGLSNLAYEVILRRLPAESETRRRYLAAAYYLARCAGVSGMGGGQCLDLEAEHKTITLEELIRLEKMKTGALLRASLAIPGILAGVSAEVLSALETYGEEMGLLFQMTDDLLDASGDASVLGKSTGKDAAQGKTTFVTALGIAKAREAACACRERAREAARVLPDPCAEFLEAFTDDLLERDR